MLRAPIISTVLVACRSPENCFLIDTRPMLAPSFASYGGSGFIVTSNVPTARDFMHPMLQLGGFSEQVRACSASAPREHLPRRTRSGQRRTRSVCLLQMLEHRVERRCLTRKALVARGVARHLTDGCTEVFLLG